MAEDRRAELALAALVELLERSGEARWRDWAAKYLEAARESGVVAPEVLGAYGGMGSFNDLLLDPANGHTLEPMEVPWANQLLAVRGERVYRLATEASDDRAGDAGWARPADPPLEGWRCLACGHAELTTHEIEWWVARIFVPAHVGDGPLATDPELIQRILEGRALGVPESRGDAIQRAFTSGLLVTEREGVMRPCPACGSGDTGVCRWVIAGEVLMPAEDNLELRDPPNGTLSAETLLDVVATLRGVGAREISSGLWEMPTSNGGDLLDAQVAVMDAVRGLTDTVFLAIYEDVTEEARRDAWEAAGAHTWRLPESVATRPLLQVPLEVGVWQLYAASGPAPDRALPDLFRDAESEVASKLFDLGITAMIDSWHDNTEWRVAVVLSGE